MSIVTYRLSGRQARPWLAAAIVALAALLAALVGTAAAFSGPVHLSGETVRPRTGTPSTTISFAVTYRHDDGQAPASVRVVIDGAGHAMTSSVDSVDFTSGVRYRYATTLPAGIHAIAFVATDDHGFTDRDEDGIVTIAGGSGGSGSGGGVQPGSGHEPVGGTGTGTGSGGSGGTGSGSGGTGSAPTPAPKPGPTTAPGAPKGDGGSDSGHKQGAGSSTGTTTGGDRAGRTDPPGAADHTTSSSGHGATSGGSATDPGPGPTSPTSGGGTATSDATGHADGRSHGDWPAGGSVALASTSTVGDEGSGPGRSGGAPDDSLPSFLRPSGGLSPIERSIVAGLSTAVTTVAAMAFLFGKRRRDDDGPEPDEVLAANAARLAMVPASSLVPTSTLSPGPSVDESQLPRWRRPSLLEARKADPIRTATVVVHQSFDREALGSWSGRERRRIRFRVVRLLDAPDELMSSEVGVLTEGDEVELLEKSGSFWLVLCPDGDTGWLHRMTLGDVVTDPVEAALDEDDDLAPDLLSDYLERRHGG
ncbi:MAG TPA: hypothetical protein VEG29_03075 [Candidatus Binatia bacterium]|nr:hypothetical protein [Candidatus Binatia bacterium]